MKIRKMLIFCLALLFCISLSGCSMFTVNTEELLSPPALTGDFYPIAKALEKSAGAGYSLKYPAKGNYRSAVILNDITGDGVFEAFAFYSISDGEKVNMYINVICNRKGEWTSVSQQKIIAGGVDRVDFCDLDDDGIDEILVGWQIYGTSEMQLAVYSFVGGTLSQRMLQRYTYFICCDLNEDSRNEIFLINFNPSALTRSASVYQLKSDGIIEIAGCAMDGTVKSVSEPKLSELSSGKPAVYVDSVKGAGAITEVLFFEKNELVNPLYDPETMEIFGTLRPSSMSSLDINKDQIIEIPVQYEIPSVNSSGDDETVYLTRWCSFNGETLTVKLTALMNYNDGYYLTIPEKMADRIALKRDTENHVRQIYDYSAETGDVGESLVYIQSVPAADWDAGKYKGLGLNELCRYGKTAVVGWVTDYAEEIGLNLQELIKSIGVIE